MPIWSQMSSILVKLNKNMRSCLPLNLEKIAKYDFVYTLSSTNIDHSALNLVKMYVIIRSRINLIIDLIVSLMELIGPELSELSALELENLPYLTLFLHSSICKY